MLGLAGAPHCAAMCGAACTAVLGRGGGGTRVAFHAARVVAYAAAGAVAAASVGLLSMLARWSPLLQPFWVLAHAAALALGLWLLWQGRQPAWLDRLGRRAAQVPAAAGSGWQRLRGPASAAAAGGLWVAWPCGLLQSALMVAALANTAAGGAVVMAGFAAVSGTGLALGPWLWRRLGGAALGAHAPAWAARAAGALLFAASGWALGHGLWQQWLAYCAS